jgi:diguanylate cyclase (GGDEF)-like protein/PAS domain S-box-containing protein
MLQPHPEEYEALVQFLYMAPAGLVQIGNDGEIVMVNPLCAQLLMPLVRDGILTNLFIALEDVAPDLRHRADSFKERSGTICDGLQLHVATFRSGRKESQVLSLSLFKLDATRLMGVFNDVTQAVRRERELKLSQAWIHSIAVGLNDYAMVSLDETGVCQTWSPNVQKVTGFRQSVIHGRSCAVFYPPHSMSTQRVLDRLHEADVSGWSLDEGWRQHADGSRYWGNCLIVPSSCNATDLLVEKRSYDLILCDVSERQAAYDARQDLLSRDHLTGLSNRRALFEAAELEFQRWNRMPRPMTVVMIDIDHFKQVNDRYGHAAGDAVLCQLAAAMSASFGPMDTLARLGGEEFVALLPGRTVEEAAGAAESLRHRVEQHPAEVGEHLIRYTISAGVSEMKTGVADVNALFQLADTAMYAAKKNGRNCVKL